MSRPALLSVCAALAVLMLGPAACSHSDGNPQGAAGGGASSGSGSSSGSSNDAGKGAVAGSSALAGSTGAAGGVNEGGATGGGTADAGSAGAALGGAGGLGGSPTALAEGGSPELGQSGAAGECESVVTSYRLSDGVHVLNCSPLDYATNPPSSGAHYPEWADFGVYDFPLPRGFWMHNLEHGAVVVTYNCPAGCADDLDAAKAWLAQLTPDAACPSGPPRILLVPDPLLDVPWAASSWGFTLRAQCFDAAAFSSFFTNHAGQPLAPEAALCGTGFDFRTPGTDTCGAT